MLTYTDPKNIGDVTGNQAFFLFLALTKLSREGEEFLSLFVIFFSRRGGAEGRGPDRGS